VRVKKVTFILATEATSIFYQKLSTTIWICVIAYEPQQHHIEHVAEYIDMKRLVYDVRQAHACHSVRIGNALKEPQSVDHVKEKHQTNPSTDQPSNLHA